jgi:hypothetical protein
MKSHLHRLATGCIAVLCILVNVSFSMKTDSTNQPPASRAELTLRQYIGPLKSIQVTVGRDTLPFILDTGGGISLITPEVAKNIGCVPFGRLTAFRQNGERIDAQRCGKVTLSLGSLNVSVETAIFDLMAVLRRSGGPACCWWFDSAGCFRKNTRDI